MYFQEIGTFPWIARKGDVFILLYSNESSEKVLIDNAFLQRNADNTMVIARVHLGHSKENTK